MTPAQGAVRSKFSQRKAQERGQGDMKVVAQYAGCLMEGAEVATERIHWQAAPGAEQQGSAEHTFNRESSKREPHKKERRARVPEKSRHTAPFYGGQKFLPRTEQSGIPSAVYPESSEAYACVRTRVDVNVRLLRASRCQPLPISAVSA